MEDIKNNQELKNAQRKTRTLVMFGKPDCLHCAIALTFVECLEKKFPLINFYKTDDTKLAEEICAKGFPVLCAYENGNLIATIHGSGHLEHLEDHLNLWFRKD